MTARRRFTVKVVYEALKQAEGNPNKAAEILNCSVRTIYKRIEESEECRQLVEDRKRKIVHLAEEKLIEKIKQGELGAICFALKCLGKEHGWVERQEIAGVEGKPVAIMIKNA